MLGRNTGSVTKTIIIYKCLIGTFAPLVAVKLMETDLGNSSVITNHNKYTKY